MRLRTLAVATAVGLVASLAPTVAAEAAAKPIYKVSISTSAAKADVGQTVKVSGKVTGPRAARKSLAVQLKVGKGAWRTVKKVRTTTSRRYSASIKVSTAGKQYLRVVAPKTKKVRQGVSRTRGLVGWRWLDLTSRAKSAGDSVAVAPASVAGTTYAKAISVSGRRITFPVNGACDTFTAGFGVRDGVALGTTVMTFISTSAWGNATPVEVAPNTAPKSLNLKLQGASTLGMDVELGAVATVVNPRVHCTVNTAPSMAVLEMS